MPYAKIDEKTLMYSQKQKTKNKNQTFASNLKQNQPQKTKILIKILGGIFLGTLIFLLAFIPQTKAVILTGTEKIPRTPTILSPVDINIKQSMPVITGLTSNDTEIEVFIDNTLKDIIKTQNGPHGIANFAYKPNLPLCSGVHSIRLRAKSIVNPILISLFSETKQIEIASFPAPTLIAPADKSVLSTGRPVIKGLAKNDSYIKLYINEQEETAFQVNNHPSGTANFAYKIKPLKTDNYSIYAKALDLKGSRESKESNQLNIKIQPYVSPTILSPENNITTLEDRLVIKGVALNDSKINIYVDNELDGSIDIYNHQSGVGSFAYQLKKSLKRGQSHLIAAIAIDNKTERQSDYSNEVKINVNYHYIAPTILKIIAINKNQPTILGLAHNDSKVEIFINNKLDGSLKVDNHPTGTANFAYKIQTNIKSGTYKITSRAYDERGKSSLTSNSLSYYLAEPKLAVSEIMPIEEKKEEIPPSPIIPEEAEKPQEDQEGKIETKDEEQGKVTITTEQDEQEIKIEQDEQEKIKDEEKEEEIDTSSILQQEFNTPLIVGLLILGILIIIFIIWYFKQKHQESEENLDNLFGSKGAIGENGASSAKPDNKNKAEIKTDIEAEDSIFGDFANSDLEKEKKDNESVPPPPPPSL